MGMFKIERVAGQRLLTVQGQKGQQISEREFYAINTGQVPGLLRAELVKKGSSFKLNYNISGFISLREYLVNPLGKASFAKLLGSILSNLKALQNAYYNYQFILFNIDAAMVNPANQRVSFVYVPITFYESGTSLKEFLLSIIQSCSFIQGENTDYVRDYIKILNSGINFSVFELEEYVKRLNSEKETSDIIRCARCGNVIQSNVNFCPSCGVKLNYPNIGALSGIYDPAKNAVCHSEKERAEKSAVPDSQTRYSETVSSSYITDVSQAVASQPILQQQSACLLRNKTGERINITSDFFKMGKDPNSCDYCVDDNPAISRCHIALKQLNGRWYINDLNSTNKTYINGKMLLPNTDFEVSGGANIRLANEDFIFYII